MASVAIGGNRHDKSVLALRRRRIATIRSVVLKRRRQPLSTATAPAVTQPHYRRAADTIIEETSGNMLWSNGIDPMLRFTPYNGLIETAGVLAPTAAPILSGNGAGGIVGTFSSYVRFVDRDGQFSTLSPLSNVYTPAVSVANVSDVSNASPMVVTTTTVHGLSGGQIVSIDGVMGTSAANNVWTVLVLTSTTFALVNSDGTNSIGNGTYNSGGTVTTGVATIQYANVQTPTEAKVTRRQILRNKDGESIVYYIDIDTTDLTSTTFTSNTPSLSLTGSVSLFDTAGNTLVDKTPPPNYKKYIASVLGRMFAAGIEPYSEGAIALTNGSPAVTGIGTEWGQITFPGRVLTIVGGDKAYTIQSMSSQTSLTLATPYTGTTDPYAYYTILPQNPIPSQNFNYDRRTIYWSAPSQPEAWPTTFQQTLAEDPGAGEITGLMAMGPYLFVLAESRIYQFSFVNDPLTDGYETIAARRGCVNNRCWVQTEDSAYMLDYRGMHIFSGNDDNPIGSVEIQDLFRARQTGKYKINWSAKRNFHAIFDPTEAVIRWFVTMSGDYYPRHALCYAARLRRWWIEEYAFPIGASCLGRLGGRPQVFYGSTADRILATNSSSLDGTDPNAGTVSSFVTSAGTDWLKDTSATFPTSGVVNAPVVITQGTGKGQIRRIVAVSGQKISVSMPWSTTLDVTSRYQIGGIKWIWKSGWVKYIPGEMNDVRSVAIQYRPGSLYSSMFLRTYSDFSETANVLATTAALADGNGIACLANDPNTDYSIDSTKTNGYVKTRIDASSDPGTDAPRFLAIEVGGTTNADPVNLRGIQIEGVR